VLIINRPYFFSSKLTVAFADTPFKKLVHPKKYRQHQNITRLTELIWVIMMQLNRLYPKIIHLPTATLLKTLVESNMPVMAPSGESKSDKPRLPSVNASLCLMPGIEATQVPNKRLELENMNPTASAGFILIKPEIFLIIRQIKFTTSLISAIEG